MEMGVTRSLSYTIQFSKMANLENMVELFMLVLAPTWRFMTPPSRAILLRLVEP
jgi:hypothetical protein